MGEHSKITPCTLLEWLPAAIIEKMVVEFRSRLRRELVKLRQSTEVLRHWTTSTDTRRISLDSMATTEEGHYDQETYERVHQMNQKRHLALASGKLPGS